MHTHQTSATRWRTRSLLAGAVLLGFAGTIGLSAEPAGAATTVTYQASVTQAGPLSGTFAQTAGGDGWAVALSTTQVFNVPHHQATLTVACHNQSNGSLCWPSSPTKTITQGATNFATPPGAGLYLNPRTGKLYTYVTRLSDNTAGVACIDTTLSAGATGAQMFCGFTPLSGVGDAPTSFPSIVYSGIAAPVQVGTDWYAFNEANNATVASGPNGTQNTLMCFSLTTFSACPSQPYTVPLGGITISLVGTPAPDGSAANEVFVQAVGTAGQHELGCFDDTAKHPCAAPWPLAVAGVGGSPFARLNGSGSTIGLCLPIANNPCYQLNGSTAKTPPRMPPAIGQTTVFNGPAVVNASSARIYLANHTTHSVDCFDYVHEKTCPNFPKPLSKLVGLYTVTSDPYRANCLWVNSDQGTSQIQNFDALSGGACSPGPIRFFVSSAVNPGSACAPTTYQSLQVTSPPLSSYQTGKVQFADSKGNLLPIPALTLNRYGSVDLSSTSLPASPLPEIVITLNGLTTSPANVSLRLTWSSSYSTSCFTRGQTVSQVPGYWMGAADGGVFDYGNAGFFGPTVPLHPTHPMVGIAALGNRSGYWEVASDGGIFAFGAARYYGSTGAIVLNKPIVGMAPTPTGHGYWLVASDGGIFSYGDAQFYGSAGNIHLNKPIVGMAATPDGGGYWLVASDGGIFSYGDAQFYGSTGNIRLNKPVVGMAAVPTGGGYWMVASDGGIFAYGTAGFHGSTGNIRLNRPVVGMVSTYDGAGYWLAASDGGIFAFGDAKFGGSAGGLRLVEPVVGIAS